MNFYYILVERGWYTMFVPKRRRLAQDGPTDNQSTHPIPPTTDFDRRSTTDGAPLMFSPTSGATAGQFDTEADQ